MRAHDFVGIMNGSAVLLVVFIGIIILLILAFSEASKTKREYGVKSVTARGEEVKSMGERRIADYFAKNNINYVYEREAKGNYMHEQ